MDRTYNKDEISYMNTKYGGNWIHTPEKDPYKKEYVLYATGNATMSGRIYVALPNKPLTNEDKIKYNIM